MKKIVLYLLLYLPCISVFGQVGDKTMLQEEYTLEEAEKELPLYCDFLKQLKTEGFVFWDFKTYWNADKGHLPGKLIVIRHDIHNRDVKYAYFSSLIERNLLGKGVATYFVMYDFPEEETDTSAQQEYLKLISYLKNRETDIQPHISPIDMYVAKYKPSWKDTAREELEKIVLENYAIDYRDQDISYIIKDKDVLNLNDINKKLPSLLIQYNNRWKEKTGLTVEYYAAHGSKSPINLTLFNNQHLLDQRVLLKSLIYKFDAYNTKIFNRLAYLSDNQGPEWMDKPKTILPGRYQFLMHPAAWNDITLVRKTVIPEADSLILPENAGGY